MNKVVASADEAVRDVPDGATLVVGGFGLCGIRRTHAALVRRGPEPHGRLEQLESTTGVGLMLRGRQIRKMVSHG
jgi:3-oxoacid CoA-transferase subunit A